jgi:hypothetical protein
MTKEIKDLDKTEANKTSLKISMKQANWRCFCDKMVNTLMVINISNITL